MYKFFLYFFGDLEDSRESGKVVYDFYEVLFMSFIGIICGIDGFSGLAEFSKGQESWLKKYIKLKNGVPSHDTFRNILNMLDPDEFGERFRKLFENIMNLSGEKVKDDHLQIDGKSIKGSRYFDEQAGKHKIIHTVNVLSERYGLSLYQKTVGGDKYTSETTAIKEILSILDLKDKIISVDAGMSFRDIAELIRKGKGHYVFSIKENNPNTYETLKNYHLENGNDEERSFTEEENTHGRKSKRVFYSYKIPKRIRDKINFKDSKYLGIYDTYDTTENIVRERRYFITSKQVNSPEEFYRLCRGHWGVENKLHWILDVQFNEDRSRVRKGNAPKVMLKLRQLGFNMLKMDKSKGTFASKKRKFMWDLKYRNKILKRSLKNWSKKKS